MKVVDYDGKIHLAKGIKRKPTSDRSRRRTKGRLELVRKKRSKKQPTSKQKQPSPSHEQVCKTLYCFPCKLNYVKQYLTCVISNMQQYPTDVISNMQQYPTDVISNVVTFNPPDQFFKNDSFSFTSLLVCNQCWEDVCISCET